MYIFIWFWEIFFAPLVTSKMTPLKEIYTERVRWKVHLKWIIPLWWLKSAFQILLIYPENLKIIYVRFWKVLKKPPILFEYFQRSHWLPSCRLLFHRTIILDICMFFKSMFNIHIALKFIPKFQSKYQSSLEITSSVFSHVLGCMIISAFLR